MSIEDSKAKSPGQFRFRSPRPRSARVVGLDSFQTLRRRCFLRLHHLEILFARQLHPECRFEAFELSFIRHDRRIFVHEKFHSFAF